MHTSRGPIIVAALSAVSVAFLWLTSIPLGIPGEWTWERISPDDAADEVMLGAVQAAIVGVVFVLVAWLGSRRIRNCTRLELTGWLLSLVGVGFGWLLAVQEAPPSGWRLSKAAFVLYYPGSSGYFHKARYEITDTGAFLERYEDMMAEGDVLHVGTHPPGLFLMYRGLIDQFESQPALTTLIASTAPASINEAFEVIDANLMKSGKELTASDRAVIWLVTLLTQFGCALAVVPIFLLIRQTCSRETAWQVSAFWPLLPALAIFIPKSDVLFVLPAALLVQVWMSAARRKSFTLGLLAGVIGWVSLFCSLAFLPIGLMALVASVLAIAEPPTSQSKTDDPAADDPDDSDDWKSRLRQLVWPVPLTKPLLGGLCGVVGLTLIVSLAGRMNLISIWIQNYHNHAAFYEKFTRTVWKWWLVNPLELTLAAGVPVMCLVVMSAGRRLISWRSLFQHPLLVSFLTVWTLLWLSGKNSGEAARLWCPLLPVLLAVAAGGTSETSKSTDETAQLDADNERNWLFLLSCQAVVCLGTVLKVSGFHF